MDYPPGMSLLICCHNSRKRIEKTLEHIADQRVPPGLQWEVLLIDNQSSDGTAEFAQTWWTGRNPGLPLQVLQVETLGLRHAREAGLAKARYAYILFCDDDNWLGSNYMATAFELMESNADIGALGGWGEPVFETGEPAWFAAYHHYFATGKQAEDSGALLSHQYTLYGAGLVIRKSAYDRLNRAGYQPFLLDRTGTQLSSGSDIELTSSLRLAGYALWYDERLAFKHYLPQERMRLDYLKRLRSGIAWVNLIHVAYIHQIRNMPSNAGWYVVRFMKRCLFDTMKYAFFLVTGRNRVKAIMFFKTLGQEIRNPRVPYRVRLTLQQWVNEISPGESTGEGDKSLPGKVPLN